LFFISKEKHCESYIGVTFGTVDYSQTSLLEDTAASSAELVGIDITSTSKTESGSGNKFFYGYRFTPAIAVEFSYSDLGKINSSGSGSGGGIDLEYLSPVELSSVSAAVVFQANLTDTIKPFAKVGVNRWDMDGEFQVTASAVGGSGSSAASLNDSGSDVLYGVGFDVSVLESLALRVEYERFDIDSDLVKDASMFAAGLSYTF